MSGRQDSLAAVLAQRGHFAKVSEVVAGAVSPANPALGLDSAISQLTAAGATDNAFSLADGQEGQLKTLYLKSKASTGNAVVTPANLAGGTTITLSAAGQWQHLLFVGGKWVSLAGTGAVA